MHPDGPLTGYDNWTASAWSDPDTVPYVQGNTITIDITKDPSQVNAAANADVVGRYNPNAPFRFVVSHTISAAVSQFGTVFFGFSNADQSAYFVFSVVYNHGFANKVQFFTESSISGDSPTTARINFAFGVAHTIRIECSAATSDVFIDDVFVVSLPRVDVFDASPTLPLLLGSDSHDIAGRVTVNSLEFQASP